MDDDLTRERDRDSVGRNTRDIVVRTEQQVRDLDRSVREFIQEQRGNYAKLNTKLDANYASLTTRLDDHEALINKGKGARWLFGALVALGAWTASFLPHPKIF